MFDRFTDRARKVMVYAKQHAEQYGSEMVCTEHVLLGLCDDSSSVAAKILKRLNLPAHELRQRTIATLPPKVTDAGGSKPMPFSPRVKRVIDLAGEEAAGAKSEFLDTSHLLIALYQEERGVASTVLKRFQTSHGLGLDRLRAEAKAVLDDASGGASDEPVPGTRRLTITLYVPKPAGDRMSPLLVIEDKVYIEAGSITLRGVAPDKAVSVAQAVAKDHGTSIFKLMEHD